jgi:predicted amidohydrolase
MRVSLIQLAVTDDESPNDRRDRVEKLVRAERDHRADLVVLPELWLAGGFAYDAWRPSAEPLTSSPTVAAMSAAAADLGAWLHAGSYVELGKDGTIYNTSLLFDADGNLFRTYRKIHRFGFEEGEATLMGAGDEIVTAPTDFGVFGLATCYDLRFPEQFRLLGDAGAELLVICSAWPARRIEHWRVLNRARAIESQVFVFSVNCVGTHAGATMGGRSVIIDPWGAVVAEAGTEEETLRAEIDPSLVGETRRILPVLRDQRLR